MDESLEKRLQIVLLSGLFEPALESKHGGILKKHHSESAHQAIMHTVIDFSLLTAIIDLPESLCHFGSQGREAEMFFSNHPPTLV